MNLTETTRLNGLEPWLWLSDVKEKLPLSSASRLDELPPGAQQSQE